MSTTVSMTKFNFMDISDFDDLQTHDNKEVCVVDIDTDITLHNKVTAWGLPDEANAIAFTFVNSSYVAPAAGFIRLIASTSACTVSVNEYNVIVYAASYNNTNYFMYPVQEGDVVALVSGSAQSYIFVPLLGNTATPDPVE